MKKPKFYGLSGKLVKQDLYLKELQFEAAMTGVKPPVIINDMAMNSDPIEVAEAIDRIAVRKIFEENYTVPICSIDCERPTAHRYNLGRVCPSCGYVVTENRIESEMWVRAPDEVGYFVNPRFWIMFNASFGKKLKTFERNKVTIDRGNDLMMWMLDPGYTTDDPDSRRAIAVKRVLEEHGYERGIANFIDNHKTIFRILTEPENWDAIYKPNSRLREESDYIRCNWRHFFETQSDGIFTKHLPLISSKLVIVEEGKKGIMFDPVFTGAIDAVKNIARLYTRSKPVEERHVVSRALKANRQLAYFYHDYRSENGEGKTGNYRGKVSSTHVPFSGRATISPVNDMHDAFKLKAPWRWMVGLMKVDIESKLMRRGYDSRQVEHLVAMAAMQHTPEIEEIMKELIRESPGGYGIMVDPLRNPTLVQLAIQTLFIDEVITDVNQCSLRISVRAIKSANADFDGDQLQVRRPIDLREMELAMAYTPEKGFMSATEVDRVSSSMVKHNELISIENQFLADDEEDSVVGISLEAIRGSNGCNVGTGSVAMGSAV